MSSRETDALIQYMHDSGVPSRVASVTRPGAVTVSGNLSRHAQQGTGGIGLAVDFAAPKEGHDTPELKAIYDCFARTPGLWHELIYAGGGGFLDGKPHRYAPKVLAIHHDHVHVSVDRGTFVHWQGPAKPSQVHPDPPAPLPPITKADGMQLTTVPLNIPLDPEGRGNNGVDVPFDRVVGLILQGPNPQRDHGYWESVVLSAQQNGNGTLVVATEGKPLGNVQVYVKALTA